MPPNDNGCENSVCAPNCGQVVINNENGTVIINIYCCCCDKESEPTP